MIWHDYLHDKQSVSHIALHYGISESTVKRLLRSVRTQWNTQISLKNGVVQIDVTYFGRNHGVMVAIDARTGIPLYRSYTHHETARDYASAIRTICSFGYQIEGIVIDGKQNLFSLFADYKIQMCQFHMRAIIRRKLTKKPKLQASLELRDIMYTLTVSDRQSFEDAFHKWQVRWQAFINERTVNLQTGRSFYTHQRLHSAAVSIKFYLPYLFTYQAVIDMPNTNNKIEGLFTSLKTSLHNHSGMCEQNRQRYINGFLEALKIPLYKTDRP